MIRHVFASVNDVSVGRYNISTLLFINSATYFLPRRQEFVLSLAVLEISVLLRSQETLK